ncbi:hypothetical protein COV12_00810 [Candidatus Woesearchaeota archaeon CG10_big_fil_rev_8_21_14_0_10_32_24]|nr:MAG: hypothetical protein COV12_00810 [Candidatus Woesearchaeota archaeon CG10_big_fil_rev_8_21_14_0_10_32_24]
MEETRNETFLVPSQKIWRKNKMVFGIFKRKDPICGMKEEKGKGIKENGNWFCSTTCEKKFAEKNKTVKKGSCCRG